MIDYDPKNEALKATRLLKERTKQRAIAQQKAKEKEILLTERCESYCNELLEFFHYYFIGIGTLIDSRKQKVELEVVPSSSSSQQLLIRKRTNGAPAEQLGVLSFSLNNDNCLPCYHYINLVRLPHKSFESFERLLDFLADWLAKTYSFEEETTANEKIVL